MKDVDSATSIHVLLGNILRFTALTEKLATKEENVKSAIKYFLKVVEADCLCYVRFKIPTVVQEYGGKFIIFRTPSIEWTTSYTAYKNRYTIAHVEKQINDSSTDVVLVEIII